MDNKEIEDFDKEARMEKDEITHFVTDKFGREYGIKADKFTEAGLGITTCIFWSDGKIISQFREYISVIVNNNLNKSLLPRVNRLPVEFDENGDAFVSLINTERKQDG